VGGEGEKGKGRKREEIVNFAGKLRGKEKA